MIKGKIVESIRGYLLGREPNQDSNGLVSYQRIVVACDEAFETMLNAVYDDNYKSIESNYVKNFENKTLQRLNGKNYPGPTAGFQRRRRSLARRRSPRRPLAARGRRETAPNIRSAAHRRQACALVGLRPGRRPLETRKPRGETSMKFAEGTLVKLKRPLPLLPGIWPLFNPPVSQTGPWPVAGPRHSDGRTPLNLDARFPHWFVDTDALVPAKPPNVVRKED